VSLPRDAVLVELRSDAMTFRTRECLLPGTPIHFALVLEGRPLALEAPVDACLVVERDRSGFTYHVRCDLNALPPADRQIVGLFIAKGRGSPQLLPPVAASR
jgi:hypothetical protein